jgi:hypothetical protein
MARIFPKIVTEGSPHSEYKVYNALKNKLNDEFWVFHSVAYINNSQGGKQLVQGEADFLIIHPDFGMLVLEVKGGERIMYDAENKKWSSVSFSGEEHKLKKDPFLQAQKNVFNLIEKIKGALSLQKNESVPFSFGYAVVFPDAVLQSNSAFPGHVLPEIMIDANGISEIGMEIGKIFSYWKNQSARNAPIPESQLQLLIDQVLLPHFELHRPFKLQLQDEEQMIIRLTDRQFQVLNRNLKENKRAVIKGFAGTGKTLLALMKAGELAAAGKKVLYLCYNTPLANSLKSLSEQKRFSIFNYHSFARAVINKYESSKFPKQPDQQYWDSGIANDLFDVIDSQNIKFDAILVDEAQDFKESWWTSIEMMLKDDSEFYVFYDPKQNIYSSTIAIPKLPTTLPLVENCRNTIKINEIINKIGAVDLETTYLNPMGEVVFFIDYMNQDHLIEILKDVIKAVKKEYQLKSSDIILLSPSSFEKCLFSKFNFNFFGYKIIQYSTKIPAENELQYESLFSFKGLDANAVILFDITNDKTLCSDINLYVAVSRAKHLLYVLHDAKRMF